VLKIKLNHISLIDQACDICRVTQKTRQTCTIFKFSSIDNDRTERKTEGQNIDRLKYHDKRSSSICDTVEISRELQARVTCLFVLAKDKLY